MKKIFTIVIVCILSFSATLIYAGNMPTNNYTGQCYITGNVEVRVEKSITNGNNGYNGLRVSMNNKNDFYANIVIYLKVDGVIASREYQFVLDPKETRVVNLFLFECTSGFQHDLDYEFHVTKCN